MGRLAGTLDESAGESDRAEFAYRAPYTYVYTAAGSANCGIHELMSTRINPAQVRSAVIFILKLSALQAEGEELAATMRSIRSGVRRDKADWLQEIHRQTVV